MKTVLYVTLVLSMCLISAATPSLIPVTKESLRKSKYPIESISVVDIEEGLRFSLKLDCSRVDIESINKLSVRIWRSQSVIFEITASERIEINFLTKKGNLRDYRCEILAISDIFGVTTAYEIDLASFLGKD